MNNASFLFNNKAYAYYLKLNSNLLKTERIVELSFLEKILEKYGKNTNLIEIGCVSPYYFETYHNVYDLKDPHPVNKKENAKNINLKNKSVISVSTIEHFNTHGYYIPETDFLDPAIWLKEATSLAKKYFITFPIGFNKNLDSDILLNSSNINTTFLTRQNKSNIWVQKNLNELTNIDKTYDFTYTYCANTIAIIQNLL